MPAGEKHGHLSKKASRVYEALRREHPEYSKTKSAKIANAVTHRKKK